MTTNKLTDETLSAWKTEAKISLGETARDSVEYYHHEAILTLVTEIQEHRKAAAEPVLYVMGMGCAFDAETASTCKGAVDSWVGEWNQGRLPGQEEYKTVPLYATPQPLNDAEWAELQERRKADIAEPIYQWREAFEEDSLWDDCTKSQYDGFAKKADCEVRILYTAPPASEREHIRREHAEWSDATFGDVGLVGPLKHLSKEALETAAEPDDLSEWADMQFLLWDAQRRAGITDEQITRALTEKLAINKSRQWPEPKDGEPRLHIKEQPVPVVPEEMNFSTACNFVQINGMAKEDRATLAMRAWNACRAAMLQGGEPVSQTYELPQTQFEQVADLYTLCWQSGEVVTYTTDPEKATIWLNNYSGTCVQEYAKLERLQETLSGNSPVIPGVYLADINTDHQH